MISPKGVTVWVGYNSCSSLGDTVSEKENYEKVSKSPSVGTCFCLYEQGIIFTAAFVFLFVFPAEANLRQGISFVPLPSVEWDETCLSKRCELLVFLSFQDIVLTLKDKLSIRAIEYFALVLEQQYSITKLLLLHEDELIQRVKEKNPCGDIS